MEDYSAKETDIVYKGRYPLHSNEVVLAGILADKLDKKVRDRVTIKVAAKQADYLITGLSQSSNMGGMNASIRRDGFLKLTPDLKQQSLQIYLNKNSKSDVDKTLELGMGTYVSIVLKLGIGMIVITLVVVILVLYFVINSSVLRRITLFGVALVIVSYLTSMLITYRIRKISAYALVSE